MQKALTVYQVKVEHKNGKVEFLVVRTDVNGKLTVPRGYRLIEVIREN